MQFIKVPNGMWLGYERVREIMSARDSVGFRMRAIRIILALLCGSLVVSACNGDDRMAQEIRGSDEDVVVTYSPDRTTPMPEPTTTPKVGVIHREVLGAGYRGGFHGVEAAPSSAWSSQCGPSLSHEPLVELPEEYLHWTGDGSRLVFGHDEIIWSVDVASSKIEAIVDTNPGYRANYGNAYFGVPFGLYGDVSSDGTRIVYSSCEFPTEYGFSYDEKIWADRYEDPERGKYTYEVATIGIDGKNPERITENAWLDHFPSWSPNGSRIALISNIGISARDVHLHTHGLYTMAADGSDMREIVAHRRRKELGPALSPPVWSPSGKYLAFIGVRDEGGADRYLLYTARLDGSEPKLHEIGEVRPVSDDEHRFPLPSWSPGGERLAYISDRDHIYIARADGTELRQVATNYRSRQVAWSPGSDEIVFLVDGHPHSVSLADGDATVRRWPLPEALGVRLAHANGLAEVRALSPIALDWVRSNSPAQLTWSPDGSQIAIHYPGQLLVVIDRETAEYRILLEGDVRVTWQAQDQAEERVDVSACSEGLVVPEPVQNPGLVMDCQTLLRSLEVLAGSADFHWSTDQPINRWRILQLDGSPTRVAYLYLDGLGLTGTIPLELLNLRGLDRRGIRLDGNSLRGCIPIELVAYDLLRSVRQDNGDLLAQCQTGGAATP